MVRLQRRVADQTSKLEVRAGFACGVWQCGLLKLSLRPGCASGSLIRVQAHAYACVDPSTSSIHAMPQQEPGAEEVTCCSVPVSCHPPLGVAKWESPADD